MRTQHLDSPHLRLSNERSRLATAKTDGERQLRTAWIAHLEREIAGELEHLGLPPEPDASQIDTDALLAELLG